MATGTPEKGLTYFKNPIPCFPHAGGRFRVLDTLSPLSLDARFLDFLWPFVSLSFAGTHDSFLQVAFAGFLGRMANTWTPCLALSPFMWWLSTLYPTFGTPRQDKSRLRLMFQGYAEKPRPLTVTVDIAMTRRPFGE